MERMRLADSGEKARQEGVAIAQEMVAQVRRMVAGCAIERAIRPLPAGGGSCRSHRVALTIESNGNGPG